MSDDKKKPLPNSWSEEDLDRAIAMFPGVAQPGWINDPGQIEKALHILIGIAQRAKDKQIGH